MIPKDDSFHSQDYKQNFFDGFLSSASKTDGWNMRHLPVFEESRWKEKF